MSAIIREVTNHCRECGAGYWVKPYRREKTKYCSFACSGKVQARTHLNDGKPKTHSIGNTYRCGKRPTNAFKKGHEPWNKGLKGIHLSPDTEYKKGRQSEKWVPVGAETLRDDGRYWVKVSEPAVWQYRSRVVWERHNGPVPAGYVVHHRDHTKTNDSINNLQAMTRADHAREHSEDMREARYAKG